MKMGREAESGTIEWLTTFGLVTFGAEAEQWPEEVFYYRTGIALKMWEEGFGRFKL